MKSRTRVTIIAYILVASGVALAGATIADFKSAQGKTGCDSIPYAGEKDYCKSYAASRDDYCKGGKGPWACDNLDPAGLTKQLDNVNGKIVSLKVERDSLTGKRSSATDEDKKAIDSRVAQIDEEIYKLSKLVDEWTRKLADEKTAITDHIYIGEHCLADRNNVGKQFENAMRYARAETDPEIVPIAKELASYWEAQQSDHQKAIRDTEDGIKKCKDMR